MAALNEAHTIRVNEMLKKLSDLRIEKDENIRNLEDRMAQERLVRDTKINEQTAIIDKQRKDIDHRDGTIEDLKARLFVFNDIEAQL
jgi:hypothetical protein